MCTLAHLKDILPAQAGRQPKDLTHIILKKYTSITQKPYVRQHSFSFKITVLKTAPWCVQIRALLDVS